jgi:hypothetical protein
MRIDIMRWFVPVNSSLQRTTALHNKTIDLDELNKLTEEVPVQVAQHVYLEQLYSAMAETLNILYSQIPAANRTSDYGIIQMLPPL